MAATDLRALRRALGISQTELAARVGLSRQGYAAIEGGAARPSVDVALRLARVLGSSVEALFGLPDEAGQIALAEPALVAAPTLSGPVRLAEIGGRTLAFAARRTGLDIAPADGTLFADDDGQARVRLLPDRPKPPDLVVVGCDPSFALVVDALRRRRGIETLWIQAGSRAALEALARGEAHVVGVHLDDPATGTHNATWAERLIPGRASLVRFAHWEQGLLVAPGNPLGIRDASDLARPDVRLVNREPGSGSRSLLDRWLERAGVQGSEVRGYDTTRARGHMEVASTVAAGAADVGVGIRAAGNHFGLDSVMLTSEPYDLVVTRAGLEVPAVAALFELLRESALRRQVEGLGGYDASAMGEPS